MDVHRTRQKCVEQEVALALSERPRQGNQPKLNGKAEAFLVATACSEPPAARKRWTFTSVSQSISRSAISGEYFR